MEELHLTVDGRARRAVVVASDGERPAPVVLLLHGSGGSGEWAVNETRWDEKAVAEGILLVAPDATRPQANEPARFYTNPAVWNDGSGRAPADRVSHVDDVGFIRTLLDEVARRWRVDEARIYVAGFSNGAGMTFRLARELDRIAAIAPIAGYDPGGPKPGRRVPTLYMVGTHDMLIPVEGGIVNTPWAQRQERPPIREMLARWAADLGLSPAREAVSEASGVRGERWSGGEMEAWFIPRLGHHWPGGRAGLNRRIAGPPSDAVDATAAVWEFLKPRRC